MKKKLVIIILVVILVAIVVMYGVVATKEIIKNYREDRKNTLEVMSKIEDEYKTFESKITAYNDTLKKVVTMINESTYYAKFEENKGNMIKLLDDATKQLNEISSYDMLKNNCNKTYSNGKTNRACSSYSKTYEKSVNVYIDVVKAYNNMVQKINETFPDSKFEEYKSEITEYVDYNKDGKYLGKEEIIKVKEETKETKDTNEEKKDEKEVVQNEE